MVDTLKSRTITNMDTVPYVQDSAGFNVAGVLSQTSDYASATTAGESTTSSTYKLVRLRSNCKVKNVKLFTSTKLDTNGSPTLTWDVGAYYSDSTEDGTQVALQGTSISASCFFAATATPTAAGQAGAVSSALILPASMDQMLWDFLGLSSDPGGYIDVVAAVHATAATAAAGDVGVIVDFVA